MQNKEDGRTVADRTPTESVAAATINKLDITVGFVMRSLHGRFAAFRSFRSLG
jgi:hypothetical protein